MTDRMSRPSPRAVVGMACSVLLLSGCALLSQVQTDDVSEDGDRPIVSCVTLRLGTPETGLVTTTDLEDASGVLLSRMRALGVPEAKVDVVPPDQLVLGLPAGDDATWRTVASRPGTLAFVAVPADFDAQVVDGEPLPDGMDATPILTIDDIETARATRDDLDRPALSVQFTSDGAEAFDAWAADNVGRRFAIVADGTVLSAPVVREAHFGGQASISGDFTADEVGMLAAAIGSGALPAPLTELGATAAENGTCPVDTVDG